MTEVIIVTSEILFNLTGIPNLTGYTHGLRASDEVDYPYSTAITIAHFHTLMIRTPPCGYESQLLTRNVSGGC